MTETRNSGVQRVPLVRINRRHFVSPVILAGERVVGARGPEQCVCSAGFFQTDESCRPCAAGKFGQPASPACVDRRVGEGVHGRAVRPDLSSRGDLWRHSCNCVYCLQQWRVVAAEYTSCTTCAVRPIVLRGLYSAELSEVVESVR